MSNDDDLLDLRQVCKFFGGKNSPLDSSTIYRGIKRGIYPKPFKASPRSNRWYLSECRTARTKIEEVRK